MDNRGTPSAECGPGAGRAPSIVLPSAGGGRMSRSLPGAGRGPLFQAAGPIICTSASECGQVPADFPVAAGKVVTIPNGTRGPVMTVTNEPPRLNKIGSPHTLTLTHQAGSKADVGSFRAACGNLICDIP
jgi:hypothetical protein